MIQRSDSAVYTGLNAQPVGSSSMSRSSGPSFISRLSEAQHVGTFLNEPRTSDAIASGRTANPRAARAKTAGSLVSEAELANSAAGRSTRSQRVERDPT